MSFKRCIESNKPGRLHIQADPMHKSFQDERQLTNIDRV